jgi:hypothetical protein
MGITTNEKDNSSDFEVFWLAYPRKQGKQMARKAWSKLDATQRQKAQAEILNHIRYWLLHETHQCFIPHCSTFLNQHRFEDILDFTPVKKKESKEWMLSNEGIEQKAKELGILGNGYDSYQTLKIKCMKHLGMSVQ